MHVRWLRKALRNLDEEATHIAADDEEAARLVVARILKAVAQLAEQPAIGHPGRVPGTRELVILNTRYIVPYRVRSILHSCKSALRGFSRTPRSDSARTSKCT